ncbi:MAG: threonine-phosphate decarboxylase CobD [Pseudomonadota bacterium]
MGNYAMSGDFLHGGATDGMRKRFPNAPEPWIDLSTGINPWPYWDTTVSSEAFKRLPTEAAYRACLCAMAKAIGTADEFVALAPGSELLIRLLPLLIHPRKVAILSPTYSDHSVVWRQAGADVIETNSPLADVEAVEAIIICNPNNPDGRTFSPDVLEEARRELAQRGGWLIVDEAYGDLDPTNSISPAGGRDGQIIIRSFGKFFGLAGTRLGALIAPAPLRAAMADQLGVWPVSGGALEIGARAYADLDWQAGTRIALADASARLKDILLAGGLKPVGGTDLFQYVEIDDAFAIWEHLARKGIYVRRFDWSDRHLRIGLPANPQEEARLAEALSLST